MVIVPADKTDALDGLSEPLTSLPGELDRIRIGIANRPTQLSCSASKTGLTDSKTGLTDTCRWPGDEWQADPTWDLNVDATIQRLVNDPRQDTHYHSPMENTARSGWD